MLYQLSYASSRRQRTLCGRIYPSDPFQMSGTILKGTITVILAQPDPLRRGNCAPRRSKHRSAGRTEYYSRPGLSHTSRGCPTPGQSEQGRPSHSFAAVPDATRPCRLPTDTPHRQKSRHRQKKKHAAAPRREPAPYNKGPPLSRQRDKRSPGGSPAGCNRTPPPLRIHLHGAPESRA
jgi:hypothetical protein